MKMTTIVRPEDKNNQVFFQCEAGEAEAGKGNWKGSVYIHYRMI